MLEVFNCYYLFQVENIKKKKNKSISSGLQLLKQTDKDFSVLLAEI